MTPKKITVTFYTDEWNAIYRCVSGELDSLTPHDWNAGTGKDLDAALRRMVKARTRAARQAAAKVRA